jgi:hypothetical protein
MLELQESAKRLIKSASFNHNFKSQAGAAAAAAVHAQLGHHLSAVPPPNVKAYSETAVFHKQIQKRSYEEEFLVS